jgi:hypothetical protein
MLSLHKQVASAQSEAAGQYRYLLVAKEVIAAAGTDIDRRLNVFGRNVFRAAQLEPCDGSTNNLVPRIHPQSNTCRRQTLQ